MTTKNKTKNSKNSKSKTAKTAKTTKKTKNSKTVKNSKSNNKINTIDLKPVGRTIVKDNGDIIKLTLDIDNSRDDMEIYLELHDKYNRELGSDTCKVLVLYQLGKFYETYSTRDRGPDLFTLRKMTGAKIMGEDKGKHLTYPIKWGIPIGEFDKYTSMIMRNNDYRIVVINQICDDDKTKKKVRDFVEIISPGSFISMHDDVNTCGSNYITLLTIESSKIMYNKYGLNVGMSAINVTTGETFVHESYSSMNDETLALDETIRFINGLNPKEIIIDMKGIDVTKENKEYITDYLDIHDKYVQFRAYDKANSDEVYQRNVLEAIYEKYMSLADIFDSLNIKSTNMIRMSIVSLLSFIANYYGNAISGTKPPVQYIDSKYLQLGNDAITQLNVIKSSSSSGGMNKKSLVDYLNIAATPMGRRFVRLRLVSPLAAGSSICENGLSDGINELNMTYDIVEYIMRKSLHIPLEKSLKRISDIERLNHRILMKRFTPKDLTTFNTSYDAILDVFKVIKERGFLTKYIKTNKIRGKIRKLLEIIKTDFNLQICGKFDTLREITDNIFNRQVHEDIDRVEDHIGSNEEFLEKLRKQLDSMIVINNKRSRMVNIVKLMNNKKDGYYFKISKNKYDTYLREQFEEEDNSIEVDGKVIMFNKFNFSETKNDYKFNAEFMKTNTENIDQYTEEMKRLNYEHFSKTIEDIYEKYGDIFDEVCNIITKIDYYYCIAKNAKLHNYCKPTIDTESDCSYIVSSQLRHPIVERIISHEYIPHDIDIGRELKGMMLYGLNSAGKSVLMKAIGLSLIMAQAGFFVSATNYTYKPYNACYTRITGTDDIYRGLSSYSLEMVELNAALKRADSRTLIIGDEVCRGTENISGSAIVAASLMRFSQLDSTFVFATHLHNIMEIPDIMNEESIKAFYLSVEHDEEAGSLVYDRILKPGTGERIYGIVVAKSIIRDSDFINDALRYKNIIMDIDPDKPLINNKRSRYNSKLIIDKCGVCHKKNTHMSPTPLEVHHINHQKDCEDGFVKDKPYMKKNDLSNLIQTCQDCHDKIHAGKLDIKGYVMTDKGKRVITEQL